MKHYSALIMIVSIFHINSYAQNSSYTTIHEAASNGNARGILAFIQEGINVDSKDSTGKTPLMAATNSDMSRVIPILLDQGASINETDNEGNTALHLAASKGSTRIIQILINSGADVYIVNDAGQTPRELAEEQGQTRVLSLFPQNNLNQQEMQQRPGENNETILDIQENYSDLINTILNDPNSIRARLVSDSNLVEQMDKLFVSLEEEEKKWTSRTRRIKNTFFNAVRKEIDLEILFLQSIAEGQDANVIVNDLNVLQRNWKSLFSKASRSMRDSTRASTGMQSTTRANRGRTRNTSTRSRVRNGQMVEEVDQDAPYIDSWGSVSDTSLDTLCESTQERLFKELGPIRNKAEREGYERIVNSIDGVMLERKLRTERSLVIYRVVMDEINMTQEEEMLNTGRSRSNRGYDQEQTGRRR